MCSCIEYKLPSKICYLMLVSLIAHVGKYYLSYCVYDSFQQSNMK